MASKSSSWLHNTIVGSVQHFGVLAAFVLWGLVYTYLATHGWEHWLITVLLILCGFVTARSLSALLGTRLLKYRVLPQAQEVSNAVVTARIFPVNVVGRWYQSTFFLSVYPRENALIQRENFALTGAKYVTAEPTPANF